MQTIEGAEKVAADAVSTLDGLSARLGGAAEAVRAAEGRLQAAGADLGQAIAGVVPAVRGVLDGLFSQFSALAADLAALAGNTLGEGIEGDTLQVSPITLAPVEPVAIPAVEPARVETPTPDVVTTVAACGPAFEATGPAVEAMPDSPRERVALQVYAIITEMTARRVRLALEKDGDGFPAVRIVGSKEKGGYSVSKDADPYKMADILLASGR